ncbi:class I SAM-dependent methyltransferase [Mesorhizobium xinjiangense]|uniref:class I SAM-dependent methyltransferase n=1 Tax=Mesorhizobium xinjiangense TaxID=2678685 RepID=UPI0012EEB435|nr:class I SAM-dependent methyltransferase [Mesorhizobium xinjiangense]
MTANQLKTFEMDGIRFVQDNRAGKDRGKSTCHEFILVKTDIFLDFYRGLRSRKPKHVLEVGMFEGGSMVLFDKLYNPDKLVGIDIRKSIPALDEYRRDRPYIDTLYGVSQDSADLPRILSRHFPEGIDLIVDDASHHYTLSRDTFQLTFPLLKPGGLYVLEDWSWSHKHSSQLETHPWHDKPALTNLVLELVINMPNSHLMDKITVLRDMVVVEKAGEAKGTIDLDRGHSDLRGRKLQII